MVTQATLGELLVATEQAMLRAYVQETESPTTSLQKFFQQIGEAALFEGQSPEDISALHRIGVACRLAGEFSLAERFYQRAYEISRSSTGADSLASATHRNFLAGLYFAWSRFDQSLKLIQESYDLYNHVLGEDHIHTRLTAFGAALAAARCGRKAEAQSFYESSELRHAMAQTRSLDIDRWTALTFKLAGLAAIKFEQGYLEQSSDLFRFCVLREANEAWPQTLAVANELNNLALLCRAQALDLEAQEFFQMTLELKERLVGTDHPEYRKTNEQYEELLRSSGKFFRLQ